MKALIPGVIGIVLGTVTAGAHDGSMHSGKPTEGTVAVVHGDQLTLALADGQVLVMLQPTTKLEEGEQPAARDALKPGVHVEVFGTKLPDGELVAREIRIRPAGRETEHDLGHEGHAPVER